MQNTTMQNDGLGYCYRPSLTYCHANARGTGCAIRFQLIAAGPLTDGCIMMDLANQATVASVAAGERTFATFDWERRLCVKLDFSDLCQMMQVFRGECESIADGKGLYHTTPEFSTRIVLKHRIEVPLGYSIEVYRTRGGVDQHAHILLSPSEAYGLARVIDESLAAVCFGVVSEVERGVASRRAKAAAMKADMAELPIHASA